MSYAMLPPYVYEREEQESKIKAVAKVESVKIVERYPDHGTVEKKVTFRLLKALTNTDVPA